MTRSSGGRGLAAEPSAAGLRPSDAESARAWDVAASVCDPEVPVLSVADLGVLRTVRVGSVAGPQEVVRRVVRVEITPTYSGCPALEVFRTDIAVALLSAGYDEVQVDVVLAPAWSTDWLSDEAREKLRAYGIAPPAGPVCGREPGRWGSARAPVVCPRCSSSNTRELSHFGSTACKSFHRCDDCLEPFDCFKVL
ncbi:ring-1,2-phenylacetyl-CoA epoxidase subunit PaaD [Austwickia chelonae]|uniref:Phenylacetate-CoA oxygenase subunit PaaJ n=1 Tax=Austwickia chelonae NBRC 105200 TaxID=1184607 RepID=K6VV85_9MICO|nr:1,2-phenylacetyl-CoA epoxidase subunit PaaD [Austwickia chelonae]GAB79255.1 phenylacetate-CoA oxygenase subunit PaaJ [Austwickia chelonae NBRC 105200]SEW37636.1 ring-1,2-phenylacetyl-CoA epoxidase subunit PaaD [Austwickia chelonae]